MQKVICLLHWICNVTFYANYVSFFLLMSQGSYLRKQPRRRKRKVTLFLASFFYACYFFLVHSIFLYAFHSFWVKKVVWCCTTCLGASQKEGRTRRSPVRHNRFNSLHDFYWLIVYYNCLHSALSGDNGQPLSLSLHLWNARAWFSKKGVSWSGHISRMISKLYLCMSSNVYFHFSRRCWTSGADISEVY